MALKGPFSHLKHALLIHSKEDTPEKTASFLSFPYVCPEPVLAK
jgi:hypothetical protein